MGCCGGGRSAGGSGSAIPRGQPGESSSLPAVGSAPVDYHGARGVTVIGPVTGRRYRFESGGSALVDSRDRPALLGQQGFRGR